MKKAFSVHSAAVVAFLFGLVLTAASLGTAPDKLDFPVPEGHHWNTFDTLAARKRLDSFPSVGAFKAWYGDLIQRCSKSTVLKADCPCLCSELWVRQAVVSREKLRIKLLSEGKGLLDSAEVHWERAFDKTTTLTSFLISRRYENRVHPPMADSTRLLCESKDEAEIYDPFLEQHALLLRSLEGTMFQTDKAAAHWDDSLTIAYRNLAQVLDQINKWLLKTSEEQWLLARSAQIKLIDHVLDSRYKTMSGPAARSKFKAERSYLIASITRQRALMLNRIRALSDPVPFTEFQADSGAADFRTHHPLSEFDTVSTWKTMDSFPDVESFADWADSLGQMCWTSWGSGSAAWLCSDLTWNIWEKQIELFRDRLKISLPPGGRALLDSARKEWRKTCYCTYSLTLALTGYQLAQTEGTMYIAFSEMENSNVYDSLAKQQALLLRCLTGPEADPERSPDYWDGSLNAWYQVLMNALSRQNQKLLRASELQWIKARDAQIRLIDYVLDTRRKSMSGSTAAVKLRIEKERLTASIIRERAQMLRNILKMTKPFD